jgi:hypothetical protein
VQCVPSDRYEEARLGAERARTEAQACLEAAQRRHREIAARLLELRGGKARDPARDGESERYASAAAASLQLARDRDRRAHERAARAHDAAARQRDLAAARYDARGDGAAAERQRAAAVSERRAAEEDRLAARSRLAPAGVEDSPPRRAGRPFG